MDARIPTTHSAWPLRARAWLLAFAGPALWIGVFGVTASLAGRSCDLVARLRLGVVIALGISLCGLAAVLGVRRLQQYAAHEPDARYLLLASGTLHLLCALSWVAQLIPIVLGVSCRA